MITIKNKLAQEKMATAGALLAELFVELPNHLVPGVTTLHIDTIIANYLSNKKLVSQSKGYRGYCHVSCISLNDEVVHGVPSAKAVIKEGDLVKVDICAAWQGYCADMARCFFVGAASPEAKKLVQVAYSSLDKGIEQALVGKRIGDISAAIQREVEEHGFGVVRDFAGHGIGQRMHEDPEILNYGIPGKGPLLREGMALAIEPMITQGRYAVRVMADGWTAKTADGSLAAHVEDTVIITEQGPNIITRLA
jgi:methionyl aminopeptidase